MTRKLLTAILAILLATAIFTAGVAYTMHNQELYCSDEWVAANLHGYGRLIEFED